MSLFSSPTPLLFLSNGIYLRYRYVSLLLYLSCFPLAVYSNSVSATGSGDSVNSDTSSSSTVNTCKANSGIVNAPGKPLQLLDLKFDLFFNRDINRKTHILIGSDESDEAGDETSSDRTPNSSRLVPIGLGSDIIEFSPDSSRLVPIGLGLDATVTFQTINTRKWKHIPGTRRRKRTVCNFQTIFSKKCYWEMGISSINEKDPRTTNPNEMFASKEELFTEEELGILKFNNVGQGQRIDDFGYYITPAEGYYNSTSTSSKTMIINKMLEEKFVNSLEYYRHYNMTIEEIKSRYHIILDRTNNGSAETPYFPLHSGYDELYIPDMIFQCGDGVIMEALEENGGVMVKRMFPGSWYEQKINTFKIAEYAARKAVKDTIKYEIEKNTDCIKKSASGSSSNLNGQELIGQDLIDQFSLKFWNFQSRHECEEFWKEIMDKQVDITSSNYYLYKETMGMKGIEISLLDSKGFNTAANNKTLLDLSEVPKSQPSQAQLNMLSFYRHFGNCSEFITFNNSGRELGSIGETKESETTAENHYHKPFGDDINNLLGGNKVEHANENTVKLLTSTSTTSSSLSFSAGEAAYHQHHYYKFMIQRLLHPTLLSHDDRKISLRIFSLVARSNPIIIYGSPYYWIISKRKTGDNENLELSSVLTNLAQGLNIRGDDEKGRKKKYEPIKSSEINDILDDVVDDISSTVTDIAGSVTDIAGSVVDTVSNFSETVSDIIQGNDNPKKVGKTKPHTIRRSGQEIDDELEKMSKETGIDMKEKWYKNGIVQVHQIMKIITLGMFDISMRPNNNNTAPENNNSTDTARDSIDIGLTDTMNPNRIIPGHRFEFVGFDFIFDEEMNPYFLEINSMPGWSGFDSHTKMKWSGLVKITKIINTEKGGKYYLWDDIDVSNGISGESVESGRKLKSSSEKLRDLGQEMGSFELLYNEVEDRGMGKKKSDTEKRDEKL